MFGKTRIKSYIALLFCTFSYWLVIFNYLLIKLLCDRNKYSISRIAELEKDIEDIENSINKNKNSIHPYFYNTQTTIYPHQQEVISDILNEIAHITQAKFVASNPEFDAIL